MDTLTQCEKSKLLYDLLQTRTGAFEVLLQALEETRQSGALEILRNHEPNYRRHDLITYDQNCILGRGSFGSIVYKGNFDGREVAVKVLNGVQINLGKALKEVEFLKLLDDHENIIRYFYAEKHDNFVYIALELSVINLQDEIKQKLINLPAIEILRKCTNGLAHLHSLNILHRDLKPGNILLNRLKQVKISDFGLSKKIPDGETCVSVSGVVGTEHWMAPEILILKEIEMPDTEDIKMTTSSDIFSLGCIFYFVLSNGFHAFGGPSERQFYIVKGEPQLLESKVEESWLSLILKMIAHSPMNRPGIQDIRTSSQFSSKINPSLEAKDQISKISENENFIEHKKVCQENTVMPVAEHIFNNVPSAKCNTPNITDVLLSSEIIFQDQNLKLKDIGIDEMDVEAFLEEDIYQDEINQIMNTEDKLILAKSTVPTPLEYYFPRKVSNEVCLDPKAYHKSYDDIFVFKGFKMADLSRQVAPNIPVLSGSQLQNVTSRFIFLEDVRHWEKICEISNLPIHLINTSNILEKISYESKTIWNHILRDYNNQTFLTEEEFALKTKNDKFIIMCDSVGTGKKRYLKNLAKHFNNVYKNRLVLYESFTIFVDTLKPVKFTAENLLEWLSERLGSSAFSKAILTKLLLNKKLTIQIFLHGIVYSSIQNLHMIKKFLDTLVGDEYKVQIFISCGSIFRREIETMANVSSYRFLSMNESQQVDFIAGYWKFKISDPNCSNINRFAQQCRNALSIMMQSTQHNPLYIPFLCFRLAELLLNEAKTCHDKSDPYRAIGTHNGYVFKIYEDFVDHSLNIHRLSFKSENYSETTPTIEKRYKRFYVSEALKMLCPDMVEGYTKSPTSFSENLEPFGIMKSNGQFQHESFAMFFIGDFFAESLIKDDEKFVRYFFTKILMRLEFNGNIFNINEPLITYFVDHHLSSYKLNSDKITKPTLVYQNPGEFFKVLRNIALGNFRNLFQFISHTLTNIDYSLVQKHNSYLYKRRLQVLEKTCQLLLKTCDVTICIEYFKLWSDVFKYNHFGRFKKSTTIPLALDYAVYKPEINLLKYLVDKCPLEGKNLVYLCFRERTEEIEVTKLRIEACNILLGKQPKLLNECINMLASSKINLQAIKYLVGKGINIFATYGSNSLVYNCAKYMSKEDYRELCNLLLNEFKAVELFKPTFKWRGPLHLLLEENDEISVSNVLHILDLEGISINELDEDGNNLLLCAIIGRCNLKVLNELISKGASFTIKNKEGQNALHLAVKNKGSINFMKCSEVETVKFLVSLGFGMTDHDMHGKTPLDIANEAYEKYKHLDQDRKSSSNIIHSLKMLKANLELLKDIENSNSN